MFTDCSCYRYDYEFNADIVNVVESIFCCSILWALCLVIPDSKSQQRNAIHGYCM